MTSTVKQLPLLATIAGFRRFSVAEYHRLCEIGLLTEDDDIELLEGYLINKMSRNPPHDGVLSDLAEILGAQRPHDWRIRSQCAITLPDSEPEPDLALVRPDPDRYRNRHPYPADVGLVIEVSDSSLEGDRQDKCRIYARAGLVRYWIVNIPDRQIEVYEQPSGPTAAPAYALRTDYRHGDNLPFILDGTIVATLAVQDLLG